MTRPAGPGRGGGHDKPRELVELACVLATEGASLNEISAVVGSKPTTVRAWLTANGIAWGSGAWGPEFRQLHTNITAVRAMFDRDGMEIAQIAAALGKSQRFVCRAYLQGGTARKWLLRFCEVWGG